MAQKITHWLLITLILSLGFGQLLRFEFSGVPLYLHDILILVILCLLIPRSVLKRNSWLQAKKGSTAVERTDLMGTIGIKIFLIGLSLGFLRALTLYPLISLLTPILYSLRLLAYLALFFQLKSAKIRISHSYFLISGVITLFIGLLQYFLLPDMRWAQYLGWDDHLSRLTMPHFDPTFTAVMLGLALLSTTKVFPKFWLLTSIFYSAGILLSYSRSVWLSLILTGLLFIKNQKILLVSGVLLLLFISVLPQKFGEGTNLLRTFSIESRFNNDLSIIRDLNWDLITGIGMHRGPNNSYLYLLLASGILGLVGWGMFMFSLYQKSFYKSMLIFFFLASLFNNVMFYPFALLWVLLIESTAPTAT